MACCGGNAKKVVRGAVGLAKAATGIDRADDDMIRMRRDVCRGCEHATRNPDPKYEPNKGLTSLSRCEKCSCFIAAKTLIRAESCPDGKWNPTTGGVVHGGAK